MRRNGDRGLPGGDREILDRGCGFHRTGDRWLPDRWLGMPAQGPIPPIPPSGLNDGDIVTVPWIDSSGNGHNGLKVGSPIFKKNIIGGKPVVRLRSASQDRFNLATPVSSVTNSTAFVVMKATGPAASLVTLCSVTDPTPFALSELSGNLYMGNRTNYGYIPNDYSGAFHVFTGETFASGGSFTFWVDGNVIGPLSSPAGGTFTSDFGVIGARLFVPTFSDGDIAEIILYNSMLALTRATDRANIEAGLSAKYGIAVTSGGTPVDPATVAGMLAWYKADSLL
jgi:hypothetical protein